MKTIYQLNGCMEVFSSRIKAHKALCKLALKNENTYLPTREKYFNNKVTVIYYTEAYTIVKRAVN